MKYAIVRIKGHQYKVHEGEEILVDKIEEKKVEPEVLLVAEEDKVKVGKPVLTDAKVGVKILGDEKGEKIVIRKFKAKSRYRRKTGFRASLTRLQISKISL
ncbi:MAG TPA: 50S ribosomal protein L21 [Patescibacteria group bacterium]